MQNLAVGQPITATDLAQALGEDSGTFLCQQGGQTYVAVGRQGHSIVSLRPFGRRYVDPSASLSATPEPWTIVKLSNQEIIPEGDSQQSNRQQQQNR